MAEDHLVRGLPQRNSQADDTQYPPAPGEEDDRSRAIPYHPRPQMATGPVTLPSIQDPHGAYGPSSGRGWDARAGSYGPSPGSTNGYPPPGSGPRNTSYSPSPGGIIHTAMHTHQIEAIQDLILPTMPVARLGVPL
ncbi:hypothetical protein DL764_002980 [Monosporascus ibericus]|uniref:Uncharacterized protein n=1 Tax=Monosporascus ibericus TaxID=155417 RepID=A0A4Q4TJH7_9PEZI|nr:hypothetical protein DL764_002980 [Monosporascus ibericus]